MPGRWRSKDFARTTLSQLKNLAKLSGIPAEKLTSHNLRRYSVSQCAERGIDIGRVMEWLEHSDRKMIGRYYGLRDEHAQASMRNFGRGRLRPQNASGQECG